MSMDPSPTLVIFDVDGTLINSQGAIFATVAIAAEHANLPRPASSAVDACIGLPLRNMFDQLFPDAPAPTVRAAEDAYRQNYRRISDAQARPFPGAESLVRDLHAKGTRLAVATSKSERGLLHLRGSFAWMRLPETYRTADMVARGKPHPEMLTSILAETGVEASRALMVGDTTFDVEMASAASITSCAVTWGAHTPAQLAQAQPLWTVHTWDELRALLNLPSSPNSV